MIVEGAPAKINLALHVVGQRADGYHLIQSLVTFAGASDRLTFKSAGVDNFTITGRYGEDLRGDGLQGWNLVILARELVRRDCARRGTFAPPRWPSIWRRTCRSPRASAAARPMRPPPCARSTGCGGSSSTVRRWPASG